MQLIQQRKGLNIIRTSLNWLAGVLIFTPAVAIVGVLFIYPFFHSMLVSFQNKENQWTFDNYIEVWHLYSQDFFYTVWICFVSLVFLLFLTIMLAGYLRIYQNRFIEFLFKVPLFVPFVVVGHAVRVFLAPHGTLNSALVFLTSGLYNPDSFPSLAFTTTGLIFALLWKNIGLALLLVIGAFRGVNNSYLEAASNFSAGAFRQIWDILVPMSRKAIGVVAVLIFTSMMGCFSIPAMMGNGGGHQVLMMDLYYEIDYQHNAGAANAIGVLSYLVSIGAAIYYLKAVAHHD
ncbi:ABC transporter permease [Ectobacillus polymachus]|uniref:ABC transporter permease n=1 Tax=Ectobacillus polymachus TaxID=1508806 RepID=UPI003A839420